MRRLIFGRGRRRDIGLALVRWPAPGPRPCRWLACPALRTGHVETVALVCNPVWNGYAWVRTCYRTYPRYYGARPYYYGYYGRRAYRPRYC